MQDFSAQKERQELPKLNVSDSAKKSDRVITTSDSVMPRHDSHEKMDSYTESNRLRSAIDAIDSRVEQLMHLRQRLDENKKCFVQTEPLDLRKPVSKSNRKAMNRNWSNQKANPALKPKT